MRKSTVAEIQARFDADVERFSNLETGQTAMIDSPLLLEWIARAARAVTPAATHLLDIGCGAGNYSLKLRDALPTLAHITLIDLSRPMLDRALARLGAAGVQRLEARQGDIREVPLSPESYDFAVAAAVFHHLRADDEWAAVFAKVRAALKPGGWLFVADMVTHANPALQAMFWSRYGEYLEALKGPAYRDHVFDYIEREDTPRPLLDQVDLLRRAGFAEVEILHKNTCFAAWGARK